MLIALLALTAPAHAVLSEGEWYGPDGTRLIFDGMEFKKWTGKEPDYWVQCRIGDWPISSPTAQAACLDGKKHTLRISADAVVFDGMDLVHSVEHESDESDGH